MINHLDTATVQAMVDAKRENLYRSGAAHRRLAGESLRMAPATHADHWIRRVVGRSLLKIGARIFEPGDREVCIRRPGSRGECVPV